MLLHFCTVVYKSRQPTKFAGYFHSFMSQDMLGRWTHNPLRFTKLWLLVNLEKPLPLDKAIRGWFLEAWFSTNHWFSSMETYTFLYIGGGSGVPRRGLQSLPLFCGGGGPHFSRIRNNFLVFLPWSTHQDLKTPFLHNILIDWVFKLLISWVSCI